MKEEEAKNRIRSSIVVCIFVSFGFGAATTSPNTSLCFGGLVAGAIALIAVFALLQSVQNAGYRLRVVTKENAK